MTFTARVLIAALAAVVLASCRGASTASDVMPGGVAQSLTRLLYGNAFRNSGFETGKLSPWFKCLGGGGAKISKYDPYKGKYSGFAGSSSDKEGEIYPGGGLCQEIVVPHNPFFTVHLHPVSDDFFKARYGQLIAAYDASFNFISVLWYRDKDSKSWIYLHKSVQYAIGKYAGQDLIIAFLVITPGHKNKHIGLWFDNASMTHK